MKKILKTLLVVFILFLSINVSAKEKIKLYFFHGDGCPHCAEEEKYLDKAKKKYKNFEIVEYEVWYNKKNQNFMKKVKDKMEIESEGVPLTIIGGTYRVGYSESDSEEFDRIIKFYSENLDKYTDVVGKIKSNSPVKAVDYYEQEDSKTDKDTSLTVPVLGKVNLKKVSVITASAVIGLVDGFNPCAMWVLLFLISMLIGMKDRKRQWIIGLTFLLSSAIVYMAIMLSWINIVVNISTSIIFRNIIALVGLVGAFININSYIKEKNRDDGCEVIDSKKRKKILTKIKKFTSEKSLILALLGVIGLAVSVNLVELACSAGLPLIFTQILAINDISGIKAFLYTLVYIIFFLVDDIVIFVIAMVTTKVTGISTKYNKYSHLIGGILMFIIGILLLFKPEWLMFNFNYLNQIESSRFYSIFYIND